MPKTIRGNLNDSVDKVMSQLSIETGILNENSNEVKANTKAVEENSSAQIKNAGKRKESSDTVDKQTKNTKAHSDAVKNESQAYEKLTGTMTKLTEKIKKKYDLDLKSMKVSTSGNVKNFYDEMGNMVNVTTRVNADKTTTYFYKIGSSMKTLAKQTDELENKTARLTRGLSNLKQTADTKRAEQLKVKISGLIGTLRKLETQIYNNERANHKLKATDLRKQYKQTQNEVKELNKELEETTQLIRNQGGWMLNLKESFKKAMRSFTTYISVTTVFYQAAAAVRSMINEVKELDDTLTEFRKVSDLAGSSLDKYVKKAGELGATVAKTTSEMIAAATEFRKSGFGDQESLELGKIANMYTNIADEELSAGDAASFIIAQLKAFKIEAKDAIRVVDALNEVSNNYAVSSADLAGAIGKVSATLAAGDTSYEETLGLLTAITEITRNADKAANALKTIGQRIRGIGEDGEDASEYVANLQNQFDKLGISIKIVKNSAGEMESTYNILKAMAENWDRLTDTERQALGEAAAGKNRITELNALMSNWQTAVEATSTALESNGSAARENAKVLDSIEGHLQSLRAAWQQLSQSMINSGFLKAIIDLGTGLINLANSGFSKVILRATALFAVLRLSQPIIKKIKQGFQDVLWASKNLSKSWAFLKADTKTITAYLKKTDKGFKKLTDEEKAARIEAEKLRITQVKVSLIMAAVSTAVSLAIHFYQKYKEKQQEMINKALEQYETFKSNKDSIDDYIDSIKKYKKILDDVNSTTEEKKEATEVLKDIEDRLTQTYGKQAKEIDLVNGSLEEQLKLIKDISAAEADAYFSKTNPIKSAVSETTNAEKGGKFTSYISSRSSDEAQVIKDYLKKSEAEGKKYKVDFNAVGHELFAISRMNVEETLAYYKDLSQYLQKNKQLIIDSGVTEKQYNDILSRTSDNISKIEDEYKDYIDILNQAKTILWSTAEGQEAFFEFIEKGKNGLEDTEIDELLEKYPTLATRVDILGISYDELREKFALTSKESQILNNELDTTYETVKSASDIVRLYAENLDKIKEKYNQLTTAASEYNEQGYFTKDTLNKLIDEDLLQYLEKQNGQLRVNTKALEKLAEAERIETSEALKNAMIQDIRNIALGDTESASKIAQQAIANAGAAAETNSKKFISFSAAVEMANAELAGKDIDVETQKKINAVYNAYKKVWPKINSLASGGSGSSSGKSAWEKSLESLNNQYKNSQITIEQYITKLEALRKKYKKNKTAVKELDKTLREARLEKLEDDYKRGLISVDAYIKGLKELQKAYKEGTKEWNKYADSIKKGLETLLGDREGKFKDAQKAAVSILDEEIQRIDDLISAKQKENDETERQIELQKLQENLENARRNKNKRVFVTGLGWVYQRDEQAVEEAQKALDDFQSEQEIRNLEKQKELLESYRDSWQDITKSYEQEQNRLLLAEVLGADAEGQILNQRLEVLEDFRDKYIAVLRDLNMLDKTTADSISQDGITLESGGSYANGGVVDYTGYARVHGSVNKPEIVLSNSQAASLYSMLNRPQTSSLKVGSGSNTQIYNFDNLVLPNVSNARQFINELKSITNLTRNQ